MTVKHFETEQKHNQQRVAVLLVGYGEVKDYDKLEIYNKQSLKLLTAKFITLPAWIYTLAANLVAQFNRYEYRIHNFTSPHNDIFERQRLGISKYLKQRWGNNIQVFKAFNSGDNFLLKSVLEEVRNYGFGKILIYPLLAIDSVFTSGITLEQINRRILESNQSRKYWFQQIRYIPSFCNQPEYINLVVEKIQQTIQEQLAFAHLPSRSGIVLVNQGCPLEANGFSTGIEDSEILYQQTRKQLIHRYPLISVGWLNHTTPFIKWTQPNVEQAAKNLIELGATAIVFMPLGSPTENRETTLDLDYIVHRLQRQLPKITYVQMNCVNDHPEFLKMAAEWANPQIAALLASQN